ncbi:MAG TPA: secretion protein [Trinickia sp.]|jgi:hypothetical protein|nr:secretion protein [Trinickia sp.]
MTTEPLDPVTRFLKAQGLEPQVACFESSDFVIGWRIRAEGFELVYRVEADQLIVCDFQAVHAAGGGGDANGAVLAFVRFIHRIERHVPQLSNVRGMFVESLSNPALTALRQRLSRVLGSQGAEWCEIDGDPWLVYPMSAGGSARAKAGCAPA